MVPLEWVLPQTLESLRGQLSPDTTMIWKFNMDINHQGSATSAGRPRDDHSAFAPQADDLGTRRPGMTTVSASQVPVIIATSALIIASVGCW